MGPLDIIRTQEASQVKHMESQRNQHLQEQASKGFQTMVANQSKKPVETTKSDNPAYRYDAKEKGNNQYYDNKKRKDKEKKKDTKESKSDIKTTGFNMLI